jgi:formiminotetrahydrofolate cyclodeaminase
LNKSLKGFLDDLGSSAPSPGGGAAAALVASTGTALLEMVARLNDARFRKKDPKADVKPARERITLFRSNRLRFLKLIRIDAAAFKAVSAAYKKGKDHPSFQPALKKGYSAPMEICELAVKMMASGLLEKDRTSKWLYSDLAEAGILLDAAYQSARYNVEINLKDLTDRELAGRIAGRLEMLKSRSAKYRDELRGGFAA